MGAINPAYTFVQHIAQQFDRMKFPDQEERSSISVLSKIALSEGSIVEVFPVEIISKIACSSLDGQGVERTFYLTGQLGVHKHILSENVLLETAAKQLEVLGVERSHEMTSIEQLWNHVFQEVYVNSSFTQKLQIVELARVIDDTTMDVPPWKVTLYFVAQFAGKWFNNIFVAAGMAFVVSRSVAWGVSIALARVVSRLNIHVTPRVVNQLINYAPTKYIRVLNSALTFREALCQRGWKIWVGSFFVAGLASCGVPLFGKINKVVSAVLCIIYPWYYIVEEICTKIGNIASRSGLLSNGRLHQVLRQRQIKC